jgi:hypothetical protein
MVDFFADNYASGLYLYKITAGDFVSIKKMLVVSNSVNLYLLIQGQGKPAFLFPFHFQTVGYFCSFN